MQILYLQNAYKLFESLGSSKQVHFHFSFMRSINQIFQINYFVINLFYFLVSTKHGLGWKYCPKARRRITLIKVGCSCLSISD